jgi:hypothetical protein
MSQGAVPFTVRIDSGLYERLRERRHVEGQSLQELCEAAIRAYLAADPEGELRRALNPFHDATEDELHKLRAALSLIREAPADIRTIFDSTLMYWERLG